MKFIRANVTITVLLMIGIMLLPLANVTVANAGGVKVDLSLPDSVAACATFNIAITVINDTNTSISFNKIAVAYALQDMKIRGPYEINTNGTVYTVPAFGSKTVNVPFKILFSSGVVVPITVVLANGSYTKNSIIGGTIGGVKVN